jgi:hypothetical protein
MDLPQDTQFLVVAAAGVDVMLVLRACGGSAAALGLRAPSRA